MTVIQRKGFGSFERVVDGKDEWLTPPSLISGLGGFDLDPCAPIVRPWSTASTHLTVEDDGLLTPWPEDAFVWMNPPYGTETYKWLGKLAQHPAGGIALVFARTETRGFHNEIWDKASGLLFLRGRLKFFHVDGTEADNPAGAPSVLVAYGMRALWRLRRGRTTLGGKFIRLEGGT